MKTPYVAGLVILAVAITLAVEESRIAVLRDRLAAAQNSGPATPEDLLPGPGSSTPAAEAPAAYTTGTRDRLPPAPVPVPATAGTADPDFGKAVRRMWENPAGKSMMNQGVKMMVAMMYGDFIDSLDLTYEEADYFRELLGSETATQQEFGMKILGAGEDEQMELMKEMERREKESEEAIKTFLDEDYARFEAYKDRLPERQQLDGFRAVMAGRNTPLDEETEARLVEAMHRARKQPDPSGPGGMDSPAGRNRVRDFEQSWEARQAVLRKEVAGILNEEQQEAFFEYQTQMKEFQLMSIKMAEKMMAPETPSE